MNKTETNQVANRPADIILPELSVVAKAELISSNLGEFKEQFHAKLDRYNYVLVTDQDFDDAKGDIKELQAIEKNIGAIKEAIVSGSADVAAVTAELDGAMQAAAEVRLARQKEVKSRRAERCAEIVEAGWKAVNAANNASLKSTMEAAIKGKVKYSSMEASVTAKVKELNELISNNNAVIDEAVQSYPMIAPDRSALELSESTEALRGEMQMRINNIKLEAERAKLQQEREEMERAERERIERERAEVAERARKEQEESQAREQETHESDTSPEAVEQAGVTVTHDNPAVTDTTTGRTKPASTPTRHDYVRVMTEAMAPLVTWYAQNKGAMSEEEVVAIEGFRFQLNNAVKNLTRGGGQ